MDRGGGLVVDGPCSQSFFGTHAAHERALEQSNPSSTGSACVQELMRWNFQLCRVDDLWCGIVLTSARHIGPSGK